MCVCCHGGNHKTATLHFPTSSLTWCSLCKVAMVSDTYLRSEVVGRVCTYICTYVCNSDLYIRTYVYVVTYVRTYAAESTLSGNECICLHRVLCFCMWRVREWMYKYCTYSMWQYNVVTHFMKWNKNKTTSTTLKQFVAEYNDQEWVGAE